MENHHAIKFGKPSFSIRAIEKPWRTVSHNQRVVITLLLSHAIFGLRDVKPGNHGMFFLHEKGDTSVPCFLQIRHRSPLKRRQYMTAIAFLRLQCNVNPGFC